MNVPLRKSAPALAIAGAFALVALLEVLYFPGRSRESHERALEAKGRALSELTAESVRAGLDFDDRTLVHEYLLRVANDPDVTYLSVLGTDGEIIASLNARNAPEVDLARLQRGTLVEVQDDVMRVAVPIRLAAGSTGAFIGGFSMKRVRAARRDAELAAWAIGALILSLGLFVAAWNAGVLRRITILALENEQAKVRAESASRAKTAFLANMSHELRTPLNGVLGMVDLLQGSTLNPKQQRFVDTIKVSGQHLLDVISNVLDMSKIEAGRMRLEALPFDVRELMRQLEDILAVQATERRLTLSVQVASDVPKVVNGDMVRVRQVLVNLLSNALKFTEMGGVSVKVTRGAGLVGADPSGVLLCFEVKDSGIGITKEQQTRLFQAFEQADNSTTRVYGGTGLGLAISREVTELMGGTLRAESEPGRGSTFYFEVPFGVAGTPGSAVGATASQKPGYAAGQTEAQALESASGPLCILVAEDNEINQLVMTEMLEALGHDIVVARDGAEALGLIESGHHFDVVFMDCQMPVLDGYEAARAIRKFEVGRGARPIPIIAVTAHALAGERESVLAAGMDDFVTKPATIEILKTKLARALLQGDKGTSPLKALA